MIKRDLDEDGSDELIVGYQFIDKVRFDDEDFLAVYTIGENGQLSPFSQTFSNTDEEITDLQVKNLTEDGLPAIIVAYNSVHAGTNRARWKEDFSIIRGQYPFDTTLLKLRINEGEAGNKDGTDYYREIAVELRDADNDETYEIVAICDTKARINFKYSK